MGYIVCLSAKLVMRITSCDAYQASTDGYKLRFQFYYKNRFKVNQRDGLESMFL